MQALLVDPNQADCEKLVDQLSQGGYETLVVPYVQLAREALAHQTFDVLLLEVQLPDGHGFQLCNEIRERWGDAMVIIFVSHEGMTESYVTCFQLGADDFMTKPCDSEELLARIAVRIQRRRWASQSTRKGTD